MRPVTVLTESGVRTTVTPPGGGGVALLVKEAIRPLDEYNAITPMYTTAATTISAMTIHSRLGA